MVRNGEERTYKMTVLDPEPAHVKLEVTELLPAEEPLLTADDLTIIRDTGREVLHILRDIALGPTPVTEPTTPRDDTYEQGNPYSMHLRRTQLPVYSSETERYREQSEKQQRVADESTSVPDTPQQDEFLTPRLLRDSVQSVMENVPLESISDAVTPVLDVIDTAVQNVLPDSETVKQTAVSCVHYVTDLFRGVRSSVFPDDQAHHKTKK